MALARFALKNLQQRTSTCRNSLLGTNFSYNNVLGERLGGAQGQGMSYGLLERLSTSAPSDGKEVAVQSDQGGRRSRWRSLLPRRLPRPRLWRRKDARDPFESLSASSLGNALFETAENMNRLFESVVPSQLIEAPSQLMGRFRETEDSYKLRYDVPGLTKDDLKVTIDDGVLKIRGERKVEEGDESEDEYSMSYGYYNTSLVLPDDAKQDDIKAELKDGVLAIVIPKTESHGKDVKEVEIH